MALAGTSDEDVGSQHVDGSRGRHVVGKDFYWVPSAAHSSFSSAGWCVHHRKLKKCFLKIIIEIEKWEMAFLKSLCIGTGSSPVP